jgi:hypothetical protein
LATRDGLQRLEIVELKRRLNGTGGRSVIVPVRTSSGRATRQRDEHPERHSIDTGNVSDDIGRPGWVGTRRKAR